MVLQTVENNAFALLNADFTIPFSHGPSRVRLCSQYALNKQLRNINLKYFSEQKKFSSTFQRTCVLLTRVWCIYYVLILAHSQKVLFYLRRLPPASFAIAVTK